MFNAVKMFVAVAIIAAMLIDSAIEITDRLRKDTFDIRADREAD